MACVYRIWSRETLHYYIGATDDLRRRENRHRKDIESGKKPKRWKQLWAQYPELRDPDNWVMDVVKEFDTLEEAARTESSLLQIHVGLPLCLNQRRTSEKQGMSSQEARNKQLGHTVTDETRELLRQAQSGKKASLEARKRMSIAGKGKKKSSVTRQKMSQNNSMKNPVVAAKVRAALKGRKKSPEAIAKSVVAKASKKYAKRFFEWLSEPIT